MESIQSSSEHVAATNDDQSAAIATEAEFERWLIIALEWERKHLQQPGELSSRPTH